MDTELIDSDSDLEVGTGSKIKRLTSLPSGSSSATSTADSSSDESSDESSSDETTDEESREEVFFLLLLFFEEFKFVFLSKLSTFQV